MNDQRRIMIAGPPYRDYLVSIGRAFEKLGMKVDILAWDYAPRNLVQDALFYASKAYSAQYRRTQHTLNSSALERAVERVRPDILLIMHGARMTKETQRLLGKMGTKKVLWAYDNVSRFPFIRDVASDYDLIYTYEPDDVATLSKEGRAALLPMGYDDSIYSPDGGSATAHDIVFVGAVRDFPGRKRIIKMVADRFREMQVGVWTDTIHWYSHRRLNDIRFVGLRSNLEITANTVPHEVIASIYRKHKICLNIHHQQSKACNPRSFEVLGAGGVLITDMPLDHIRGFEKRDGYLHYETDDDLLRTIELVTSVGPEARSRIASKGTAIVKRWHTYEERARTILRDTGIEMGDAGYVPEG